MKPTVSIMLIIFALFGCSDQKEKQFIAGCTSNGLPTQLCSCLADELDGNVERPSKQELMDASFSCRDKIMK